MCVLVTCSHSCGVALGSDHTVPLLAEVSVTAPKKSPSLSDEEGAEVAGAAGQDGSLLTKGVEKKEEGGESVLSFLRLNLIHCLMSGDQRE